jgi:hypothetical protein
LRYDSSLMADDEPYEILQDAEPTSLQDLRLDGNVECRDYLVGDDQPGVERQLAGDPDALTLPA